MKKFILKSFTLLTCLLVIHTVQAQVSGVITDSDGFPLIGVSVHEIGTSNGTVTDIDGSYSLMPSGYPATIVYSYVGYSEVEMVFDGSTSDGGLMMSQGVGLDEVIVTGTRGKPRTILDSPVPVDNFNAAALIESGKPQIDQMLNYKVPSFNSQNQAISDATAHYDPADLRGLGPSRTLVLVNGKRKNQSAQVYLNRTPGKGEVGVDLKSIPTAAIERVEVLRDGASAQYGSDAIAGVINMILKKDVDYTSVGIRSGVTSRGDGFNFAADLNSTKTVGDGWINYTLGYYTQEKTNRAGEVGRGDQGSAPLRENFDSDEAFESATNIFNRNEAWLAANPRAGMIVGQPDMNKVDGFVNMEYPIGDNADFYTFHGVTKRDGRSFAYYRAPYWRGDVRAAEHFTTSDNFVGYHPTFEVDILDNINAAGVRWMMGQLNADASVTYGRNVVDYTVNRSVNRDYLADHGWSPSTFKPGGYTFSNVIGNLDFNTFLDDNEDIFLGFGFEAKQDRFISREGDKFSYYKGGSDSFAGIKPNEVVDARRNNLGVYALMDYDVTDDFLIGGALRYETFMEPDAVGDRGNFSNFSYKANARYKLGMDGAVRASFSTGFRAPTLHQRYLINSQYIIVQGSPDPQLQGTLSNDNSAVQGLGVPSLKAELSQNITGGITYRLLDNLSLSVDYYNIKVKDRILFSSQIKALEEGDEVDQILQANGVTAVQFFINAGKTKTQGVDVVLNYDNVAVGDDGNLGLTLALNFNNTTIEGIETPEQLSGGGYDIFERREQFLITDSRPKYKGIFGINYKNSGWRFGLDNTLFGPVTVAAACADCQDLEHSPKLVTDVRLGYELSDMVSVVANVNNIFNVYPDDLGSGTGEDANGRFQYSSIVQQQNFLGTTFGLGVNLKLNKVD